MIKRQGTTKTLAYCLEEDNRQDPWRRHIDKNKLMMFLNDVEPFINRPDIQIRTEAGNFTIFCSDPVLFKSLCFKLKTWIREVWEPASDLEREHMESSDAKKVFCKELPHGIYRYKVFLRTNISSNIKTSFFNWQLHYDPKILTPKSVEKWLLHGRYYSSSPYIYVDNSANLSMVGLFLGNGILRVEEFIPRSSINTLIDQEQPCPV